MTRPRLLAAAAVALAALTGVVVAAGHHDGSRGVVRRAAMSSADTPAHVPAGPATPTSPTSPTSAAVERAPSAARRATTQLALRRVDAHPCAGNDRAKEVLVSLADQHVWLCAHHTVRADFPMTSGRTRGGDATPTGRYEVQALTRNTTLNPDTGGAFHVQYWIPFKWGMYGFHDAPWQQIPFGSRQYRTAGSRGCVHLRTKDVRRLFGWVDLGTAVTVVARSISVSPG